ncbi:MAG: hypothetical protein KUG77_24430 [Nannocystaceae bacterium]|nr:hypothetical protein [Nannocystaceae bacterium]
MHRVLLATVFCLLASACAHDAGRDLQRSSQRLARHVGRGDAGAIVATAAPGLRGRLDTQAIVSESARGPWKAALKKPIAVEPTAVVFLAPDFPVDVVQTAEGWRFAEDPTALYANDTPRHALRALVWATRAQRWDVLLRLAPKRYRMGLSEDDLRIAWSEGEYSSVLKTARDAVASHLVGAIVADAHEATLRVGPGHVVHLEREGDQWVIVDFLGDTATSHGG